MHFARLLSHTLFTASVCRNMLYAENSWTDLRNPLISLLFGTSHQKLKNSLYEVG